MNEYTTKIIIQPYHCASEYVLSIKKKDLSAVATKFSISGKTSHTQLSLHCAEKHIALIINKILIY